MRNLYEVLGVSKDATQEEIKKSYRQLARKHHPDRNPGDKEAEDRFKEVQNAYDILSDTDKRAQYDNPHQNVNMGFGGPDFFNDFVNNVFNFRGQPQRQERHVEINSQFEIAIDFWEAVKGCDKTLTVPKFRTCETCSGSGAAEVETCSFCAGKGVIVQRQGFVTMQTNCPQCQGAGQRIKKNCNSCKGNGSLRSDGTVTVEIPEGVHSGIVLKLNKQGNEHLGQVGDLYLIVRVNPHEIFKRNGDNLVYSMPITYSQAVLGAKIKVPTLSGEDIEIAVPPHTKNQTAITIPSKGFKNVSTNKYGDMIVWVEIDTININEVGEEYKVLLEKLAKLDQENESKSIKIFRKRAR